MLIIVIIINFPNNNIKINKITNIVFNNSSNMNNFLKTIKEQVIFNNKVHLTIFLIKKINLNSQDNSHHLNKHKIYLNIKINKNINQLI